MTSPSRPAGRRLPRGLRLRRRRDFTSLRSVARAVSGRHLELRVGPARPPGGRLGITVPRRVARQAVVRNRMKRLIRECYRLHREAFPRADLEVVVRRLPLVRALGPVCRELLVLAGRAAGAAGS